MTNLTTEYKPGVTLPKGTKLRLLTNDNPYKAGEVVTLVEDDNSRNLAYLVYRAGGNPEGDEWVYRDSVEVVSGPEEQKQNVPLAKLTKVQLIERVERLEKQFTWLGEQLKEKAEEHDLCEDYDLFVDKVNAELDVKLPTRRLEFAFQTDDVVRYTGPYTGDVNIFHRDSEGRWWDSGSVEYNDDSEILAEWDSSWKLMLRDGDPYTDAQPGNKE